MKIRSRIRTTQWNLFFRYTSFIIAIVQGLIMVPLYLKFIPIDVYGAWLASGNLLAWISAMDPGLTAILQQKIASAYGKEDLSNVSNLIGGGLFISLIILIVTIFIGFIIAYYLPIWLTLPSSIDISLILRAFKLAVVGSSMMLFSFSIYAIIQGLQGSFSIGLITNGINIVAIIISIILLSSGYGLMALPISLVFSGIASSLGLALYLLKRVIREKIGFSFSFESLTILTKLMSYTFLGRAAGIISNNIDLIFVSRFLGPEIVTVFSLTRKPIQLSREIINQPVVAFLPAISHLSGSGEIDKTRDILIRFIYIFVWVSFLVTGGIIALNRDFIYLWVGSSLFAGGTINLILCLGAFLAILSQSSGYLSFSLGNIKKNSLASLIQSLLYIPLMIYGTKYFGLYGAVFAPIISLLVITTWYYPLSVSRLVKFSSNDIKNIIMEFGFGLISTVSVVIVFSFLSAGTWFYFIILGAFFCLLYGCLMYVLSLKFRYEIKKIFKKLKNMLPFSVQEKDQ